MSNHLRFQHFPPKRWTSAHIITTFFAYTTYPFIAHGITGGHGYAITFAQILAHCIGLIWVSFLIGRMQYRFLKNQLDISLKSILIYSLSFVAAFWIGWLSRVPGLDSLLCFPILGCGLWLFHEKLKHWGNKQRLILLLMHIIGVFIGIGLIALVNTQIPIVANSQSNVWAHATLWLLAGIPAMLLGSYANGQALKKEWLSEMKSKLEL